MVYYKYFADMAKSADALASGASEGNFMQVQVLLSAPDIFIYLSRAGILPALDFREKIE